MCVVIFEDKKERHSMVDSGVSVVIATRGRSQLLRRAVSSVLAQTAEVPMEVIVVFDQVDVDLLDDLTVPAGKALVTVPNAHQAGLAGGRNTGIERSQYEFVAFCDDDDEWLPGKLTAQLGLWKREPDAMLIATGIKIESGNATHVRLAPAWIALADLLKSRLTELHPSSFLLRRRDLLGELGLVDEKIPAGYGEDYDLLLRAAKLGHVAAVQEALTVVHWDRASFFTNRWEGMAAGLTYLLDKHPEFADSKAGSARIQGQIAFAHAALSQRSEAHKWASRALSNDRRQLRAYAAWAVAARLISPAAAVKVVNRRGRGL